MHYAKLPLLLQSVCCYCTFAKPQFQFRSMYVDTIISSPWVIAMICLIEDEKGTYVRLLVYLFKLFAT